MSAFVVIATVLLSVAVWVLILGARRPAAQPDRLSSERGVPPAYAIAGSGGNTLALFVPRFDLEMSPRSMWQAHTPEYMAERISAALGGEPDPDALLDAMLPGTDDGEIEVVAWDLTPRQAHLIQEWIASGAGTGTLPLSGIGVVPVSGDDAAPQAYRLRWEPRVLLSRASREAHGQRSAWRWARHLASGLDRCLLPPGANADDLRDGADERREAIWAALLPKAFCVPVAGLPAERALVVRELLSEEGVAPWQMRLGYSRDRVYPCGERELFGDWGYADPQQTSPSPRDGLELLCDRLLAREEWSFLSYEPDCYTLLQDRTVRGSRANGFVDYRPPSAPPVVHASLDLALQQAVRTQLEQVMATHQPALAMAIVVDVRTADVVAVDSVEAYDFSPFAPIYHTFTPGSTFKLATMAIALDTGRVRADDTFDVGFGEYTLVDPADRRTRVIHEAEGSATGLITAAQCLAHSVNAGLVQIGLRVPADVFRGYLVALGYGTEPESGLGVEQQGYLRELPWKYRFTHASVCFGHELTTTLWQHAAALATIARGGERRPLRLLRGVEQDGRYWDVPLEPAQRVLSEAACRTVREMMVLGATEGTGREVRANLMRLMGREDVFVATKTGTAEKVPSETCLHVELRERARWEREGLRPTRERLAALKGMKKPHRVCYTSSMCALVRDPDTGRELMVLVVVDEPRGKERFGSRVAGPAACAILAEALRYTRNGRVAEPELVEGFGRATTALANERLHPWQEDER